MKKIVLKIEGMGCEMCVNKVTAALSAVELVAEVKVSLENASAEVFYYVEEAPNFCKQSFLLLIEFNFPISSMCCSMPN